MVVHGKFQFRFCGDKGLWRNCTVVVVNFRHYIWNSTDKKACVVINLVGKDVIVEGGV